MRSRSLGLHTFCCLGLITGGLIVGCSADDDDTTAPAESPSPAVESDLISWVAPYDGQIVVTPGLDLLFTLSDRADPASMQAFLDGVDITGSLTWVEELRQVRGEAVPHTAGQHHLEVRVRSAGGYLATHAIQYSARPGAALALRMEHASDRIDGPASLAHTGDLLLTNGVVQFAVQDVGRYFLSMSPFGGNLVDADFHRPPWEPERDYVSAFALALNLENTSYPTELHIVSDGADGGPAVIEARGPDDLMETLNLSTVTPFFTAGRVSQVPASADDLDLPVEIVNRYILEPGKRYLTWETEIRNLAQSAISFYFGDYLSAAGDMDFFCPGEGFGTVQIRRTCPMPAWLHIDPGARYAVGYIPQFAEETSLLNSNGIFLSLHGQDISQVLLGLEGSEYKITGGKSAVFRRWIALGEDIGAIDAQRLELFSRPFGEVRGTVTQSGQPVAGARIAAIQAGSDGELRVVSHWTTDAAGHWNGRLEPGAYTLLAGLPDAANPSGTSSAPTWAVTITDQSPPQVADFAFPAAASFRVLVTDEDDRPLPARISVVGFDPSPDPAVASSSIARSIHAVLYDPDRDPMPYGLVKAAFAGADGDTGEVRIEPGEYMIYVSRGAEYSLFQKRINLPSGSDPILVRARLGRVVDSTGFVSGDFHVHSFDSFDAYTSRVQRVKGVLAEGLDLFTATDHGIRIDYSSTIADLGAADLLASFVGEEITTFDTGHFNLYPALELGDRLNRGAVDWSSAGAPGYGFPMYGAYDLSPSQLMAMANADPGTNVVQLNHLNNQINGYFSLLGIDSAATPPRSTMPAGLFRFDPTLLNLFSADFTALEIWRGYHDDGALIFKENLGDYFNLLNQGFVRTLMANSDTHGSVAVPTGGPRSYIGMGDMTGQELAGAGETMARAINEGRVVATNGPFVTVELETATGTASHRPGLPLLVGTPDGHATVRVSIVSPSWAAFDAVELYLNNAPLSFLDDDDAPGTANFMGFDLSQLDVPRYEVRPDLRLEAGVDFPVTEAAPFPELSQVYRLEATLEIDLELERDTWVVVVVRGTEGVSPPLFPVVPSGLRTESNKSLENLVDGNLGEGGILSLAITNPLFVDVDGDGTYSPPGIRLNPPPTRVVPEETTQASPSTWVELDRH